MLVGIMPRQWRRRSSGTISSITISSVTVTSYW
jgi:hypothetical protein